MVSFSTTVLLATTLASSTLAGYTLSQDYTGGNFFNGFDWFTGSDPTHGFVNFLDESAANSTGLAGIMSGGSTNGAVYLGVDNTNQAPNGRNALRVQSSQAFNHGLFITDIGHMPGGVCGTWPAFWMVGPNWPSSGEIDIIEGANDQAGNKMTLHSSAGVSLKNENNYSGKLVTSDCDVNAPGQFDNAGCGISSNDPASFGKQFNTQGGGVYATEWTSQWIKIWFFPRGKIPGDISSGNPNPSAAWGTPQSVFQGNFNMDDHFKNLNIVFDTTLCGDWAGETWGQSSCAALAPTCEAYVANNPGAFKDAFWAINSLKVFEQGQQGSGWGGKLRTRTGGAVLPAKSS